MLPSGKLDAEAPEYQRSSRCDWLRKLQYVSALAGVQKLRTLGSIRLLPVPTALLPFASTSWIVPWLFQLSLYCLRLPFQRGSASMSGRNRPMKTWLR